LGGVYFMTGKGWYVLEIGAKSERLAFEALILIAA
jgi:hypothetical protein